MRKHSNIYKLTVQSNTNSCLCAKFFLKWRCKIVCQFPTQTKVNMPQTPPMDSDKRHDTVEVWLSCSSRGPGGKENWDGITSREQH